MRYSHCVSGRGLTLRMNERDCGLLPASPVTSTLNVPVDAAERAVRTMVLAPGCPAGTWATTPPGSPESVKSNCGRSFTTMFTVNEVMAPWVTVTIDGLMETLNAGETWA